MNKLSPIDRLIVRVEMTEESVRELRRKMNELERQWGEFLPAVTNKLCKEIIIPGMVQGLMKAIQLPISIEINKDIADPLDISDMVNNWKRSKEKG